MAKYLINGDELGGTYGNAFTYDLLYENSSPTGTKSDVTLAKSYRNYDFLFIVWSKYDDSNYYDYEYQIIPTNIQGGIKDNTKISGRTNTNIMPIWSKSDIYTRFKFVSDTIIQYVDTKNSNSIYQVYGMKLSTGASVNNYTTDEQVIGTYCGKPLYRKVIKGTLPSSATQSTKRYTLNIAVNGLNIDFAKCSGYIKNNSGVKYSVDSTWVSPTDLTCVLSTTTYIDGDGKLTLAISGGQSQMNLFTSQPYEITLDYTKTTD